MTRSPNPPREMIATGWSLHLPGVDLAAALAGRLARPAGAWTREDSPAADGAAKLLGRKGLLYKEPATRLALCAVHRALGLPAGRRPGAALAPGTAVVACSNLGNVRTVAEVARTVEAEGGRAVSVLDAPNVSSNIVASAVALWFGFGGPNLMVCSGSTAGLDGLALAGLLLRSRRAERVVLVGTEPDDDVASALYGAGEPARVLRAGAACVVLQPRPARLPAAARAVSVALVPATGPWPGAPGLTVGRAGSDGVPHLGDYYGAQGVVGLALAAHLAADEGYEVVGVHCDGEDGSRAAMVGSLDASPSGRQP